jgi:hypothetical protein
MRVRQSFNLYFVLLNISVHKHSPGLYVTYLSSVLFYSLWVVRHFPVKIIFMSIVNWMIAKFVMFGVCKFLSVHKQITFECIHFLA